MKSRQLGIPSGTKVGGGKARDGGPRTAEAATAGAARKGNTQGRRRPAQSEVWRLCRRTRAQFVLPLPPCSLDSRFRGARQLRLSVRLKRGVAGKGTIFPAKKSPAGVPFRKPQTVPRSPVCHHSALAKLRSVRWRREQGCGGERARARAP